MPIGNYDPDKQGRKEIAKLKECFFASMQPAFIKSIPKRLEWEKSKKKIQFFKNDNIFGEYAATYFFPSPIQLGDRLPDKSRVVNKWCSTLMLRLLTGVCLHGVGDKKQPAVARTYDISLTGRATIIPYRCRYQHDTEWFKIYCYSRTIEGVIEKFWEKYKEKTKQFQPAIQQ